MRPRQGRIGPDARRGGRTGGQDAGRVHEAAGRVGFNDAGADGHRLDGDAVGLAEVAVRPAERDDACEPRVHPIVGKAGDVRVVPVEPVEPAGVLRRTVSLVPAGDTVRPWVHGLMGRGSIVHPAPATLGVNSVVGRLLMSSTMTSSPASTSHVGPPYARVVPGVTRPSPPMTSVTFEETVCTGGRRSSRSPSGIDPQVERPVHARVDRWALQQRRRRSLSERRRRRAGDDGEHADGQRHATMAREYAHDRMR